VIEVVQGNREESLSLGVAFGMRASQEVCILLVDGITVWTTMVFIRVMTMHVMSHGKPPVCVLHELFVLEGGLLV
jgi:hypothetical protein